MPWQMKKLERANDPKVFQWSIVLKDTNECIGQISVQENGEDLTIRDIGWFITPSQQRKGYAFESASNVIDYMFNKVNIHSIETCCATCNPASFKLMEKLGFVKSDKPNSYVEYTFSGEKEVTHYSMKVK